MVTFRRIWDTCISTIKDLVVEKILVNLNAELEDNSCDLSFCNLLVYNLTLVADGKNIMTKVNITYPRSFLTEGGFKQIFITVRLRFWQLVGALEKCCQNPTVTEKLL
jgi:hypothetical protein